MGLLIITILILVISSILVIYLSKKDPYSDVVMPFGISAFISLAVLIASLISLIGIQSKFKQIVYEYEMQQEVLDNTREHNSSYEVFQITPAIFNTNKTIAKHRAYHDNWWIGIYYSEKVGNLKPLK